MSILLFGIETGLSRLTIWLSAGLYYAAAFIFKVFLILSNGSVVSAEDYKLLLNNFYIIIGIVMLFLITFNLLKGMVNPDDQKGTSAIKKIIINFITSLIIITLLPTIFSFAFDFQTSILVKQNTIGRLFGYGSTNSNNSEENAINQVTSGANMIVNGVWTAFFNVNTDAFDDCNVTDMTSLGECQNKVDGDDDALDDVIAEVERTGSFFKYTQFAGNITDDEVTYNFLLCLVGGFLLLYVGISYCLDMGVRLVKLAFYQIIAPIPIMLRVIPEGKLSGSFGKWVQITVTCYLEVFIRIFVLYFCVYLCIAIASSDFLNQDVWQYGFMTWLFTKAFIFMGLITFMKQAPKLISDITGIDSGNMKLGIKDKLAAGGAFTAGAVLGGGATSLVRNAANKWGNRDNWKNAKGKFTAGSVARNLGAGLLSAGAGGISGATRSGKSGWNAKSLGDMKSSATKGGVGATDARDKRANYKAAHGGTIRGAMMGHIKDFGISAGRYVTDSSIEGLTRESQSMGKIVSKYNTFNDTIESLLEKEQSKGDGSVFATNEEGINKEGFVLKNYKDFDFMAGQQKAARAAFNGGYEIDYSYFDKKGNKVNGKGKIDDEILRKIEGSYISKRDDARDELMNMAFEGSKTEAYKKLTAKGQAVLKDSLVNAEGLQATILENANTSVIQSIMGQNGGLKKVIANDPTNPLKVSDFKIEDASGNTIKLKDAAKVAQGQADIKIAEMNKEQAAKGDKK